MDKENLTNFDDFPLVQTAFAEYIAYFGEMLIEEQAKPIDQQNEGKISALKQYKTELLKDFNAMTPERLDLIQKVQFVYQPIRELLYRQQGIQ